MTPSIPNLTGNALLARDSPAEHLRILACAGSGKTETVAQRIARLIGSGTKPEAVVAFTFTQKASEELRERIHARYASKNSKYSSKPLTGMYVGTIHSFAYRLVCNNVSKFESYSLIDEAQFAAFLLRYANRLELKRFGDKDELTAIRRIMDMIAVIENELLEIASLPYDVSECVEEIYNLLDSHKFVTFGLQIRLAVDYLEDPAFRETALSGIEYLVVDEYQDVNRAQERLVELISKPIGPANLTVVGDDDQSIYQWRGSSVKNILDFDRKYPDAVTYLLNENRRSTKEIVDLANRISAKISNHVNKSMVSTLNQAASSVIVRSDHDLELDEARWIADEVLRLKADGSPYQSMAVLVRTSTSYPKILQAFEERNIPVTPGGRTGLFETSEGDLFGRIFCWLADVEWRKGRWSNQYVTVNKDDLVVGLLSAFNLQQSASDQVHRLLSKFQQQVGSDSRTVSLVSMVYEILDALGVKDWDISDETQLQKLGRLGALAKFIGDYEVVMRQSRFRNVTEANQAGASNQGKYYFINLARHLLNCARGNYKEGTFQIDTSLDAVELTTIHSSKGLEWPIVFVPSLTSLRFPNASRVGSPGDWILQRDAFDAARYEGDLDDELRLLYVATTRAKNRVYFTAHKRVTKGFVVPSPFLELCASEQNIDHGESLVFQPKVKTSASNFVAVSALYDFIKCGHSHLLRHILMFPPEIVEEIGYGNSLHHLLRCVSEFASREERLPTSGELSTIVQREFFLPFASGPVALNMRAKAELVISRYLDENAPSLLNTFAEEAELALTTEEYTLVGRADALTTAKDGSTFILDFKTNSSNQDFSLQLQIYAEALTESGVEVGGAEVHDITREVNIPVDISPEARLKAREAASSAVSDLQSGKFEAKPAPNKCAYCDVRRICKSSKV